MLVNRIDSLKEVLDKVKEVYPDIGHFVFFARCKDGLIVGNSHDVTREEALDITVDGLTYLTVKGPLNAEPGTVLFAPLVQRQDG